MKLFTINKGVVNMRRGVRFPKTKGKAFQMSIQKWKFIVNALENGKDFYDDGGTTTCALCQLYFDNNCVDCPIRAHTGYAYCSGTPYDDGEYPSFLARAQAELKFLQCVHALQRLV